MRQGDPYLRPNEAAEYVAYTPQTLEVKRSKGDGPRSTATRSGEVLYKRSWLDEWMLAGFVDPMYIGRPPTTEPYVRPEDAAEWMTANNGEVSTRTLRRWRALSQGPAYYRPNLRVIRYRISDLARYLKWERGELKDLLPPSDDGREAA